MMRLVDVTGYDKDMKDVSFRSVIPSSMFGVATVLPGEPEGKVEINGVVYGLVSRLDYYKSAVSGEHPGPITIRELK